MNILQPLNIIHKVNTAEKMLAFTFDDGPNPIYTPQLLKIFQEVNGKATFYMIGTQMEACRELVQKVHHAGHEIANHTYTHPYLTQVTVSECRSEIMKSEELIQELTGVPPVTFRPPYFDYNSEVEALTKQLGYQVIGAVNTAARDWEQPGVAHIVKESLSHFQNGSILLFHDGFDDRSETIEAVQLLVKAAVDKGFKLVTVCELLKHAKDI